MCSLRLDAKRRRRAGFTFAEVLAAMLFMAIVIPVAIEGLRIASRAGVAAERKSVAVRLGDRLLNEALVTGQWQSSGQNGVFARPWQSYRWSLKSEPWRLQTGMWLVTVDVLYPVQNQSYGVHLSTLVTNTNL